MAAVKLAMIGAQGSAAASWLNEKTGGSHNIALMPAVLPPKLAA